MHLQRLTIFTLPTVFVLLSFLLEFTDNTSFVVAQEPLFELPVQLIGFPVIVLSVRLSQFAKKLAYSLNPGTYKSKAKRDTSSAINYSRSAMDATMAEKEIIREFGPKACILEEPCRLHASRPGRRGEQPDWTDILRNYKVQSTGMKQWYLLSVFLGDVIRDVPLCKQLAKRLECGRRGINQFTRD